MIQCHINTQITEVVPTFKVGVIIYNDITIDQSPKMLKGRFQMFQEELTLTLIDQSITELAGVQEWRHTFKNLGIDPSRYRPSQESLLRRIKKGSRLPSIHSAADINNLASIQYQIPLGIYDLDKINGDIEIRMGHDGDGYEAINGRYSNMNNKLLSSDNNGPFGSPIVDSVKTMVTTQTKNALQLVYLRPSMSEDEAPKLLHALADLFTNIHSGTTSTQIIT